MKFFLLLILIFSCFFAIVHAQAGTITIEISGIKKLKGNLRVGLYDKAKGFPDVGKEYKGIVMKIKTKFITCKFLDVPNGDYAIAAFQDSNTNAKVDKNFWGIPTELYAFSGNASGYFSTPTFKMTQFKLNGNYNIKMKLK
jgi:uncharacterized protein (DUF2141 family)